MSEEFFVGSGTWSLFGAPEIWVAVANLAGMFLVLAFRPQQIADPWSFRLSYILFALYFILPSSIHAITWLLIVLTGTSTSSVQILMAILQLSDAIGKVFLGLSIIFVLGSMLRRWPSQFAPRT